MDWIGFPKTWPTWPLQATIFGSSLGLPQRSFCPVRVTLGLSPKFRQCAISLGLKEWKKPSPEVRHPALPWLPDRIRLTQFRSLETTIECKMARWQEYTETELVLSCWQKWHEENPCWGYSNSLDKRKKMIRRRQKQSAVWHHCCEVLASRQLAKATLKWITQCKHACSLGLFFWLKWIAEIPLLQTFFQIKTKLERTGLPKRTWNI